MATLRRMENSKHEESSEKKYVKEFEEELAKELKDEFTQLGRRPSSVAILTSLTGSSLIALEKESSERYFLCKDICLAFFISASIVACMATPIFLTGLSSNLRVPSLMMPNNLLLNKDPELIKFDHRQINRSIFEIPVFLELSNTSMSERFILNVLQKCLNLKVADLETSANKDMSWPKYDILKINSLCAVPEIAADRPRIFTFVDNPILSKVRKLYNEKYLNYKKIEVELHGGALQDKPKFWRCSQIPGEKLMDLLKKNLFVVGIMRNKDYLLEIKKLQERFGWGNNAKESQLELCVNKFANEYFEQVANTIDFLKEFLNADDIEKIIFEEQNDLKFYNEYAFNNF